MAAIQEQIHGTEARAYREQQKKRFNGGIVDEAPVDIFIDTTTLATMAQPTGFSRTRKSMLRQWERETVKSQRCDHNEPEQTRFGNKTHSRRKDMDGKTDTAIPTQQTVQVKA